MIFERGSRSSVSKEERAFVALVSTWFAIFFKVSFRKLNRKEEKKKKRRNQSLYWLWDIETRESNLRVKTDARRRCEEHLSKFSKLILVSVWRSIRSHVIIHVKYQKREIERTKRERERDGSETEIMTTTAARRLIWQTFFIWNYFPR